MHQKCKLLDYTIFKRRYFDIRHQDIDDEEWWSTTERIDAGYIVQLAAGYESGGREIFLNVFDGEIIESFIRADIGDPMSLEDWIDRMKDAYCRLQLLPCPGKITLDCTDVPEYENGRIMQDEIKAQTGDWPTNLDIQYVRQVYRDHGWPNAFQRDAAFSYMRDLLVTIGDEANMHRRWPEAESFNDPREMADY